MWVSNLSPEEMTDVLEPIFVQLGCGHCLDQNTFRNWGVKDATAWGFRSGKGLRLLLRSLRTSLTDHSGFAKKSLRSSFCPRIHVFFPAVPTFFSAQRTMLMKSVNRAKTEKPNGQSSGGNIPRATV
jgi:hypothetical protein